MRGIVLSIFIMVAVVNCGDGGISDSGGTGGQSITPVDKQSVTSLYGTYTITSYKYKSPTDVTWTTFDGDNVTGELIIDSQQVRYRVQYDDGVNSYYNFNLLDNMSRTEYEEIAYAIKNDREGNFIKSAYEIQLGRFGLQKISDNPKDLDSNQYGPVYDRKLTPVRSIEKLPNGEWEWNYTGTYRITSITNNEHPRGFSGIMLGFMAFEWDGTSQACPSLKTYMPLRMELPSSLPSNNPSDTNCYFFLGDSSDNTQVRFSVGSGSPNVAAFILEKFADAVLEN